MNCHDVKPKDFNFVFNYGVNSKNGLNTIKGEYTKDMVIDPSSNYEFNII